jgi:hypothetical protein
MIINLTLEEVQNVLTIKQFVVYKTDLDNIEPSCVKTIIEQIVKHIDFEKEEYKTPKLILAYPITITSFDIPLFEYKFAFLSDDQSFHFELKIENQKKMEKTLLHLMEINNLENSIASSMEPKNKIKI